MMTLFSWLYSLAPVVIITLFLVVGLNSKAETKRDLLISCSILAITWCFSIFFPPLIVLIYIGVIVILVKLYRINTSPRHESDNPAIEPLPSTSLDLSTPSKDRNAAINTATVAQKNRQVSIAKLYTKDARIGTIIMITSIIFAILLYLIESSQPNRGMEAIASLAFIIFVLVPCCIIGFLMAIINYIRFINAKDSEGKE